MGKRYYCAAIFILITIFFAADGHCAPTAASELAAAEADFIVNCPEESTVAVYDASANDILLTELFETSKGQFTILERSRLKDLLAEQSMGAYLDPATAARGGMMKYAKYIATVDTDLNAGAPYDVDVRLIRTKTGEVIYEKSTTLAGENPLSELGTFLEGVSSELAPMIIAGNYPCRDAQEKADDLAQFKAYKIFRLAMDMEFRNKSGCNFDRHTADIVLSTQIIASKEKKPSGNGAGTMEHEPINRCKSTFYGGVRTVNQPFLVSVEGFRDEEGVHVLLDPHDLNENYYKGGKVYNSGSILKPVFENAKGKNVSGTLAHFILPKDLDDKGEMKFKIKTPPRGGGWVEGNAVMKLIGEGEAKGQSLLNRVFGGCSLTAAQ